MPTREEMDPAGDATGDTRWLDQSVSNLTFQNTANSMLVATTGSVVEDYKKPGLHACQLYSPRMPTCIHRGWVGRVEDRTSAAAMSASSRYSEVCVRAPTTASAEFC